MDFFLNKAPTNVYYSGSVPLGQWPSTRSVWLANLLVKIVLIMFTLALPAFPTTFSDKTNNVISHVKKAFIQIVTLENVLFAMQTVMNVSVLLIPNVFPVQMDRFVLPLKINA